jgi:hypothetical protein
MECFVLRKNYFAKIINYIKKVYVIGKSISRLADGRKSQTYSTGEAAVSLQLPSNY